MKGIVVSEIHSAYKKYNKIISGILLALIFQFCYFVVSSYLLLK